ncbi:2-aminoethylphosphonate--pyruvate transaminase [Stappia indica]|uniref:2-aminoethylphosphonate--pyruvate transaminase n=1 Tax=Stappia indica TaxID=538381 RepID=UPI001CD349D7|nr:2-aminoethylphosphonate--pyruvate transaminase [Stappia indica]MCA1298150.1 2-aminoethylphosphonate--pyruvate transaminase [Stappia indica]
MHDEPILLTPGPLTTSAQVKQALPQDWGSRDPAFVALTGRVLDGVRAVAGAGADYAAVPVQGSGTFAVEAMLGTLVAPDVGVLVLVNGAYGQRIAEICRRIGRHHQVYEVAETEVHDMAELARRLEDAPEIGFVAAVHCETTSGLLNPLAEIARTVREAGRELLVDSMSGFGALPLDARELAFAGLAASANKCLQGVPGLGFVLCRRELLDRCAGHAHSLVLDLHLQEQALAGDGQWRFTPPVQVMAALDAALAELREEGGPAARLARYTENCDTLLAGMTRLGFASALPRERQAPVIVSFLEPQESWFDFTRFYDVLRRRGYAIYAGKMRQHGTFRVGTIGAITPETMHGFLEAVTAVITEMKQKLIA